MRDYSFIILTFNEAIHLPRLLSSIAGLGADIFILDSGSEDATISIAHEYNAKIKTHPFENHPKQWEYALRNFSINTPWIIGLDADQVVSSNLYDKLSLFSNDLIDKDIMGIYFNRHNYFKGKRLRFGGYANKYLLKMFRNDIGYSDLNENMDHRFVVPGKTIVWKDAILKEENLKENNIQFWLQKHLKYSDLVAQEEFERRTSKRSQTIRPTLFGNPDQRIALYKFFWWKLPLYIRPFLYFFYRFIFRLGILEGREGKIFHFLQAFWFRLIVDIKTEELLKGHRKN